MNCVIPYINESLQKRDTVLLCVSCTVFELGWWCLLVQLHTFLGVLTHSSLALPCPPSLPQKNTITSVHSLLQPGYPGTDLHIWHVHKSIWEKSSLYSSKLLHAVKSVAHPIWIYQCMYFFFLQAFVWWSADQKTVSRCCYWISNWRTYWRNEVRLRGAFY